MNLIECGIYVGRKLSERGELQESFVQRTSPTLDDIFGGSSVKSTNSTPYPETPHHIHSEAPPSDVNGVEVNSNPRLNGADNQVNSLFRHF